MRKLITTIMLTLGLTVPVFAQLSPVYAAGCGTSTDSKGQVLQGVGIAGGSGGNCTDSGVNNTISAAVEILSIIAGIAAIIMIVVSSFRYITSGGDSNKVSSAKSTLIYALVGVAIAAVAQFLVHFVFNTANTNVPGSCTVANKTSLAASDPNCK